MIGDIFARIVLGHLVGDYLFQGREMALKKSENSWRGIIWCTVHSLIYTACVCSFLWTINPLIWFLIFLSHWPFDRWSLGSKWLKLIRGRDFMEAFNSNDKYRDIHLVFSCIVYVVVDNTLHLLLMCLIAFWLL
ncbi:MAG: DUF3307 domain-containing protein [Parcubacteria group bacterium]